MDEYPGEVVDDSGNVFVLEGAPIGRGGQGVVFRTQDPDVAVKFLLGPTGLTPREPGVRVSERLHDRLTRAPAIHSRASWGDHSNLRDRLDEIRILPLPRLRIAKPLSVLRTYPGYTMQLLRGMVPIGHLIAPPGTADLALFYRSTGGLRRRLELLAGAASTLMRLHAIPLIYADVSPANLFVSEQHEASEVWLIDADNLAFESRVTGAIHTPGYGAPEIVQGTAGATTLSDAWSFATLAFQVLAQVHPFLGDHVEEAGWDDEEDREALALAGRLAWIDDPDDRINQTERGMRPRALVLSPLLSELFAQTFGAGRQRRADRPSLARFADALRQAADLTLACPSCGWTFFVTARRCPSCTDAKQPAFLQVQVNRFDPVLDESEAEVAQAVAPVWHAVLDAPGRSPAVLRRHVVAPALAAEDDPPALELRQERGRLVIEPVDGGTYWLVERGAGPRRLERATPCPMPAPGRELHLHCGPLDRPHRLVSLCYWDAER